MRNRILLIWVLFLNLSVFAQDQVKLSSAQKDNFSLYLYAVQSELLGDYQTAKQVFDMSVFRQDSSVYLPSLLSSLNLRLASADYGPETDRFLKLAYQSGADEKVLSDMMINYKVGKKEYSEAKVLCEKLLEKNPRDKHLLSVLAVVDFSSKDIDSALIKINEYESLFPLDRQLYMIKREILAEKNLYDSLLSYNERICQVYPDDLGFCIDLANDYTAVGRNYDAYNLWKYIKSQDSTTIDIAVESYFFYSNNGYKNESIETAKILFESPFVKNEAKSQVLRNLFLAVDPLKDSAYIPFLNKMLYETTLSETDSTDVVRDLMLGYFHYIKDYKRCIDILSSLHFSMPDTPKYTLQTANCLVLDGRLDCAFSLLDSAIIASPHNTDYVIYSATLMDENTSRKDAFSFVEKAIKREKIDTCLSNYYSFLADLYHKDGKLKNAFRNFDIALRHYPDNSLTLNNYAYFMALEGIKLDKALQLSHRSNTITPSNPTYMDTEAFILFKLGRYKEAKTMMEDAFALLEGDPSEELLLHYADILASMGNIIQARNYYNRALKAGADASLIESRLNRLK